jgi:hypothetical protein
MVKVNAFTKKNGSVEPRRGRRRSYMKHLLALIVATAVFACAGAAGAQQAPEAKISPPIEKKDEKKPASGKRSPIVVEHTGSDPVGLKLAYVVKEMVNNSNLFTLTTKDEKKIVLVLATKEEFADRPKLASVYGLCWLYSAKDGSLRYYLANASGVVDAQSVEDAAQAILSKTSATADSFAYLFV